MRTVCRNVLWLVVSLLVLSPSGYASECPLRQKLTASDKDAMFGLAKRMGIADPVRLCSQYYGLPGGCDAVRVESKPTVAGHRRTWRQLLVGRSRTEDAYVCPERPSGSVVKREGKWIASSANLEDREAWRIHDGDWSVDVRLETGVRYSDAELIVRAIRRRELTDRMPTPDLNRLYPTIDADEIARVRKSDQVPDAYEVWTGEAGGTILTVKIVNGQVELYGFADWMVRTWPQTRRTSPV